MSKKEKPLFYCDNCGAEVPQDAKDCPRCGRSFASVRCPVCGFTGEAEVFNTGCPNCGYSVQEKPPEKPKSPAPALETRPDALPLWVYIVTGIVFLGVLVLVYFSIR